LADGEKEPAFMSEQAHPAQLRQPAFCPPIVDRATE
jgi:hypothetical protein